MGELWGVFCEYLCENLPGYITTALFMDFIPQNQDGTGIWNPFLCKE